MRMRKKLYRDNRGSSLVLVVACSAFLMMLCFVLLHLAAVNNGMKAAESKHRNNFYSAEAAMEEIRTGIEVYASEALSKAYVDVMENYINSSDEDKQELIAQRFIEELENSLTAFPGSGLYSPELIGSFLTNTTAALITCPGENILDKDDINTEKPQYIILRNIRISYIDEEQLRTSLSTDIVISTPNYGAAQTVSLNLPFAGYPIIADNGLQLNTAVDVTVNGSIYSGEGGILLDNSSALYVTDAKNIITRGDIKVRERSLLKADGNLSVWTRNMMTLKGSDTTDSTAIDITGSCFVADDVTLNAGSSSVKLAGEYYGYSYGAYKDIIAERPSNATDSNEAGISEAEVNAAKSSAIIINGRDCTLDLSALDTLFIAGRAYLDPGPAGSVTKNIYTGESISVKDSQYTYLVPAEYLWCGVNPVPAEVYQDFHANTQPEPEIDFDKAVAQPFPIRIQDYAEGASKLFYQLSGGQSYVYYYLRFRSSEHANEYLRKYYEAYQSGAGIGIIDIDRHIAHNANSILLNDTLRSMMCAGNIYTFNTTDLSDLLPGNIDMAPDIHGNRSASLTALEQISGQLSLQYASLQHHLEPFSTKAAYDENSLFNSLIHTQNLMSDITGAVAKTVGDYVVYIVNNAVGTPYEYEFNIPYDASLPNNGRKGIVIATGTVRVSGSYEGMIIAGKDIRLESMTSVSASNDIVREIISANDPDINRYLRAYASADIEPENGEGHEFMNIASLITFRNWRRNSPPLIRLN